MKVVDAHPPAGADEPVAGDRAGKRTLTEQLSRGRRTAPPSEAAGGAEVVAVPSDAAFSVHLGGGEPLAAADRARFEGAFATDLGRVRVHDDPAAHATAAQLGARAFSAGDRIGFGAGQRVAGGPALLAHELAHVVAGGGAAADRIDRDPGHEDHADRAAAAAIDGRPAVVPAAPPAIRLSPLPQAIGTAVARVHLGASESLPATDFTLAAQAELVPVGQTPGTFDGFPDASAARQRALQAVDARAAAPEVHAAALVRDRDGRYHVFDTGRRPLQRSGEAPPAYAISILTGAGDWTVEGLVRATSDEAATQTGAGGLPVLDPQAGPTCGAASLVAYVVGEDRARGGTEHAVFTAACDHLIRWVNQHRTTVLRGMRRHAPDADAAFLDANLAQVARARTLATAGDLNGAARQLTTYAYQLFRGEASVGMVDGEAGTLATALGIGTTAPQGDSRPVEASVERFDQMFFNPVVAQLHAGEAAQVSWLSGGPRYTRHYFLIGRRRDNAAYFYDQATQFQRSAPSMEELHRAIAAAVSFESLGYFPPGGDPGRMGLGGFTARRIGPSEI